jgi:spermidine/putrescine transport system ATP-binding protein
MTMADRIVVMNKGRIEQIGRGQDIYREPTTLFVADFIGDANLLPCEDRADSKVACPIGDIVLERRNVPNGRRAVAVLRPEHITLFPSRPESGVTVAATVEDVIHVGSHVTVNLSGPGDIRLACRVSGPLPDHIVKGAQVFATFRPEDLCLVAD